MKIIVVDSLPVSCSTLARGLRETSGYEALCAASAAEALSCLRIEKDSIGLIILSLEMGPETGLLFIQTTKEYCKAQAIRVPRFLVLTPGPLTAGYENRFRIIGAECLLLGFEQQVHATVRRMMFETVCEKGKPTIIVDRSGPDPKFFLLGPARSELIRYGPRLLPIINYMAIHYGTEISTRRLAEVADITQPSIRVYLNRLRARFDEARLKVGVEILGKQVFCTIRRDGAFVHILRARLRFV